MSLPTKATWIVPNMWLPIWPRCGMRQSGSKQKSLTSLPSQISITTGCTLMHTVYGQVKEVIPADLPIPLGKLVTLMHYVDANLYHDLITGRSVTSILHLVNKMTIDWYSKKQAMVETATYGSKFIVAWVCINQSIDLKTTLWYLGVPIRKKAYMFRDNKSVMDSSTIPHSKLHKRHNALSFHHVQEAIAAGILAFYHIEGTENPADILSKHWGYQQIWRLLHLLLFWKGDTRTINILELYKDITLESRSQDS